MIHKGISHRVSKEATLSDEMKVKDKKMENGIVIH